MQKGSTLFLKIVIYLMAVGALGVCVFVLPQLIGPIDPAGYDPILIGMYATAIPFFVALYQALKLLSYIDNNTAFSAASINALNNIKYCALVITMMYAAGMPYIYYVADKDDAPGVILVGLILAGTSFVVAVFAAVLRKLLQNAMDIKSENDLTV